MFHSNIPDNLLNNHMVLFTIPPLSRTKKWASIFLTLALNRGCTVLYLTTENLGDLHAMIPGFTDLIGVFAIKVDSNVDNDDGFITITRFFLQYQLRLQRTSSCSKIPVVPPLSGELFALHLLFDIIHPSFFQWAHGCIWYLYIDLDILHVSFAGMISTMTVCTSICTMYFSLDLSQLVICQISIHNGGTNQRLSLGRKSNHETKVLIFLGPLIAKSCPTCSTWDQNGFD